MLRFNHRWLYLLSDISSRLCRADDWRLRVGPGLATGGTRWYPSGTLVTRPRTPGHMRQASTIQDVQQGLVFVSTIISLKGRQSEVDCVHLFASVSSVSWTPGVSTCSSGGVRAVWAQCVSGLARHHCIVRAFYLQKCRDQ